MIHVERTTLIVKLNLKRRRWGQVYVIIVTRCDYSDYSFVCEWQ